MILYHICGEVAAAVDYYHLYILSSSSLLWWQAKENSREWERQSFDIMTREYTYYTYLHEKERESRRFARTIAIFATLYTWENWSQTSWERQTYRRLIPTTQRSYFSATRYRFLFLKCIKEITINLQFDPVQAGETWSWDLKDNLKDQSYLLSL